MMAALTAAEDQNNHVMLLERQQRVGRKLLATGNGRCNLTNVGATAANYHGEQPDFVRPALRLLPPTETLALFRSFGLLTVTEPSGRVYPLSDSASSVLDVLRFQLMQRGVELRCDCVAGKAALEKRRAKCSSPSAASPARHPSSSAAPSPPAAKALCWRWTSCAIIRKRSCAPC